MDQISTVINYKFKDHSILNEALTHPSFTLKGSKEKNSCNYERLEFLGDSVLGMIISEMLFNIFPEDSEGSLAKKKMALICGTKLAEIAKSLDLGKFIIMANSERLSGGEHNSSNLENALEALIGAMYVDGGAEGLEAVRKFVFTYWYPIAKQMINPPQDFKSMLQEWSQSRSFPIPTYRIVQKLGPQHCPIFTVEIHVEGYNAIQASGNSKRSAEQKAAELMLISINSMVNMEFQNET